MTITRKNIVIILRNFKRKTGANSTVLDLSEALYQLGHNVNLGLYKDTLFSTLKYSKYSETTIPLDNIFIVPEKYKSNIYKPTANVSLKEYLAVVVKQTIETLLKLFISREKTFLNLLSSADIIFIAAAISDKDFNMLRSSTNAVIVRNHAGSPAAFENYFLSSKEFLEAADSKKPDYVKYCLRYDALLFQAPDQANDCALRDRELKSRCFVVPPSCQEHKVLAASQLSSPYQQDRRSIAYVGSIQPRKAQHIAVEAFSKLAEKYPDTDLHFIGGGLYKEYGVNLNKMVKQYLLSERIFLHGHRPDYLRFMAHAEFVIQTSEAEGVSRILREAMLMQMPIISFSISGTSRLLRSGIDALLVEPYDIDAFSDAMAHLLSKPSTGRKLAATAYKEYLLNNSWPAYATNLKRVVEDLSDLRF